MSKVNNENFIVIQGWMIGELQLKGNELLVYAIIYGFSQAENQKYTGSLQYLADWTNSTKQGVSKNLKSLVNKGLLFKEDRLENGVKFCSYYATKFNGGMQQSLTGYATKFNGGMQQSLTNNINKNINNTIKDSIGNTTRKTKHKYGANNNVLLTDEELQKLKSEFSDWQEKIDNLSFYIASTGKAYKSHYMTILNWARKDSKQPKQQTNKTAQMLEDSYAMMNEWAES